LAKPAVAIAGATVFFAIALRADITDHDQNVAVAIGTLNVPGVLRTVVLLQIHQPWVSRIDPPETEVLT